MRKDLDLPVEASIKVTYACPDQDLHAMLADWQTYMARETRAEELSVGKAEGDLVTEWDIEGIRFGIGVARVG